MEDQGAMKISLESHLEKIAKPGVLASRRLFRIRPKAAGFLECQRDAGGPRGLLWRRFALGIVGLASLA